MRVVIQRVSRACVRMMGETHSEIGKGFLVLIGITVGDKPEDAEYLAEKCVNLRIFEDDQGKMNRTISEVGGSMLAVSNFTLYADTTHGRRPSFIAAARPEEAVLLYEFFIRSLKEKNVPVETGAFGGDMQLELVNDGPVTIIIDSKQRNQ